MTSLVERTAGRASRPGLSLWRLEWLRLVRTRRWLALFGVYLFFGLLGPFTARYMDVLLGSLAGDIEVALPPPAPADGILQYVSNASQIALLVLLALAALALALDARPEIAAFFRSRVGNAWTLLVPRYVVMSAAASAAFTLGALGAWYESVVLLGALPVGGMLAGIAYGCLYLAFAVAVVALASGITRSLLATVAIAAAVLLTLPVLGFVGPLREWLPSHLVGALTDLAAGGAPREYLRAAGMTLLVTAGLLPGAAWLLDRREI
jgi:ABC-2 type transport system permease protein